MTPPRRRWMLAAALLAAGCKTRRASSADARRDGGAVARRVVSLVPSATELLFALGAGDRVVGVSNYCDYPPAVTRLPHIGAMVTPSFEAIVALRPDAVVGVQGPVNRAVLDRLVGMGVRGVFPRVESMADVHTSIDVFAALVGRQAEAVALHARIRDEVARVEAAVRGRPKPRVLAVFGQRPLVVAGNGCWFDEVLQIAGGENVVGAAGSRYPMVSIEQALAWQPEVVIDLTWHEGNGTLAAAWAGYTNLPAVAHGKVFRMDDPMMVRQGPRIGQAALALARVLHPEAGL